MNPLVPTGVLVPRIEPGSDEWLTAMSASKVAAALGLSPFESPFSLYHRMTGMIADESTPQTRRGHYLEPAIAAWFADQRPDLQIVETGSWVHPDRPEQIAAPDRLAIDADGNHEAVELKSAADADEWGDEGTDQIPAYYRPQVMWQLDTLGLQVCHVAVILPFLEFRSYAVRYDPAEAAYIRRRAFEFLDRVRNRVRPDIDDHSATYQTVRELHPDIDGDTVTVTEALATEFLDAIDAEHDAKAAARQARARMADAMGTARYAECNAVRVARRQTTQGCAPFVVAAESTKKRRSAA